MLKRINKLYNEKQNIKNKLDQIGNEASIFNNDKLLTNIKLETIDDMATNDIFYKTTRKDKNNNNIKIKENFFLYLYRKAYLFY